jgi:Leucine-rich repeat (LRR) protein
MGLFIVLISFFNFAASIEVDCGLSNDRSFFEDLSHVFPPNSQICGFKVDGSENSSEIDFDFPVDDKTPYLTLIYTNTSIPILPAELFRKFPDKKLSCGFYKLASIKIERDWFKHAGNLFYLFFYKNHIPKLEGGKFVDLKNLASLNLERNFIKEIDQGAFAGLDNLKILKLSYSEIEYLHSDLFQNLTALSQLGVYYSKLVQLHPNHFKNLANLTHLYLYSNSIKEFDQNIMTNGSELGSSNKIFLFDGLVSLQYLNLAYNHLTKLGPGTFKNLGNLTNLNLMYNLEIDGNR